MRPVGLFVQGWAGGYQSQYARGADISAPMDFGEVTFRLAAPGALVVTPGIGSAALTWRPNSKRSTAIHLFRFAGTGVMDRTPLVVLPPDATSYLDQGLKPGVYTYQVASFDASGSEFAYGPVVNTILQTPPLDCMVFWSQILSVPNGRPASQVDQQGNWLVWPVSDGSHVDKLATLTPTSFQIQGLGLAAPGSSPSILLNAAGEPHLAFADVAPGNASLGLKHAWRDATGWQVETVAVGAGSYFAVGDVHGLDFLLAPDGTLHLIYQELPPGGLHTTISHAIRGPSGWTFHTDPSLRDFQDLILDSAGVLHGLKLVFDNQTQLSTLMISSQNGDGTWSTEAVPGVAPGAGSKVETFILKPGSSGALHVLVKLRYSASQDLASVHVVRQGGLWSSPEIFAHGASDSNSAPNLHVRPADQRLFNVANTVQGLTLFTRAQGGQWQSQLLAVPCGDYIQFLPFLDRAGKFRIGTDLGYANLGNSGNLSAVFWEQ